MQTVLDVICIGGLSIICAAALLHKKRRWGENP
jgi:hypothetical protein